MMHASGKHSCDHEMGSIKHGWHVCGRGAVAGITYENPVRIELHYCKDHTPLIHPPTYRAVEGQSLKTALRAIKP